MEIAVWQFIHDLERNQSIKGEQNNRQYSMQMLSDAAQPR